MSSLDNNSFVSSQHKEAATAHTTALVIYIVRDRSGSWTFSQVVQFPGSLEWTLASVGGHDGSVGEGSRGGSCLLLKHALDQDWAGSVVLVFMASSCLSCPVPPALLVSSASAVMGDYCVLVIHLGFLRRNIRHCTTSGKRTAYVAVVRSVLEYREPSCGNCRIDETSSDLNESNTAPPLHRG